jgi:hypothetical protein
MLDVDPVSAADSCKMTTAQGDSCEASYSDTSSEKVKFQLRARQKGGIDGRSREGDLAVMEGPFFDQVYKALNELDVEALEDFECFLVGNGPIVGVKDRLENLVSRRLVENGLGVELVLNRKHWSPPSLAELSMVEGVTKVTNNTRQGCHPRLFVHPVESENSLVMKSRFLSCFKVIRWTLISLQRQKLLTARANTEKRSLRSENA